MAFDSLVLAAVADELREHLHNARIEKIYQPTKTEIIFHLRQPGEKYSLLFSAHPVFSRVHLTRRTYVNPKSPPPFCMLLRKHLAGGQITGIEQKPLERVLNIKINGINEQGEQVERVFVAEIMGRYSNLILITQAEQPAVLGAIKYVSAEMSRFRTIKPGKPYYPPPEQPKLNPLTVSFDRFKTLLLSSSDDISESPDKLLVSSFRGISPLIAREAVHRSKITSSARNLSEEQIAILWKHFKDIISTFRTRKWEPVLVKKQGKYNLTDYAAINLQQYHPSQVQKTSSMSAAIEKYYYERESLEQRRQLYQGLKKKLKQELEKAKKKKVRQLKELEHTENAEHFRKWGELILAQMSSIPTRAEEVTVTDLYSGDPVTIPLDPRIPAPANAQRYFQKYHKYKKSKHKIEARLRQTENEIVYLESVLFNMEKADMTVLEEIREELREAGYLTEPGSPTNAFPQRKVSQPLKFVSSEGYTFYVGRNNRQNDYLTLKKARKKDTWLHAKDIPGAHVVIEGENPPPQTIKEAAIVAAYYSKGSNSSNVPVDYTLIRHVRKPPKARAGMVIYNHHRTIYVTPEQGLINRLKQED